MGLSVHAAQRVTQNIINYFDSKTAVTKMDDERDGGIILKQSKKNPQKKTSL